MTNDSRIFYRRFLDIHWTSGLLLLAFLWNGTKHPVWFCLWGGIAVAGCARAFWTAGPGRQPRFNSNAFLLYGGLLLALVLSVDSSNSLYPVTQGLVFCLLWLALRGSDYSSETQSSFWITLYGLALATLLRTCFQWLVRHEGVGFLPINPTFNAAWMAGLAAAFLARAVYAKRSRWETGLCYGLSSLLALLVFWGHSRGGLLALLIGFSYIAFTRYSLTKVLLGILLLTFAWRLSDHSDFSRRYHLQEESNQYNYRVAIWEVALSALKDKPLTGYGLGNFETAYLRHAFPVYEEPVRYSRMTEFAHNEILQAGAEGGLAAMTLLLLWIGCVWRHAPTPTEVPAKAALMTWQVAAFFNPIWHMPFLIYVSLLWSSMLFKRSPRSQAPDSTPNPWMRATPMILCAVASFFLVRLGLRSYASNRNQWDAVTRWNPKDAAAWHALSFQQADLSSAIRASRRAVALAPEQPYYHESLARMLEGTREASQIPQALMEYQTAFQLAPTRAIDALAIGRLFYREGDLARANSWFQRSRQLEPFYWEADLWIARCAFQKGEKRKALSLLRGLPRRRAEFEARYPHDQPKSDYERIILSYNARVVHSALQECLK